MLKLRQIIKQSPIKTIPIILCVLLLLISVNTYYYKVEADSLIGFKNNLQIQEKEQEWEHVSSVLNMGFIASRHHSKTVAIQIENDLLNQYPNLDILKKEFDTTNFSNKFHDILKNRIVDDGATSSLYPNTYYTVVGFNDGVIEIFSDSYPSEVVEGEPQVLPWDIYSSRSANPYLTSTAIESVLNKDSKMIFWQSSKITEEDCNIVIKQMDLNSLKPLYMKHGLEIFKNFSFVSPSYITETGDIFNIDDTTFTTINDNYKIVILQSFNMYDILEKYQEQILDVNYDLINYTLYIDNFLTIKTVKTVSLDVIIILICILFINIYNSEQPKNKVEGDGHAVKK